jgi:hypothetical protein
MNMRFEISSFLRRRIGQGSAVAFIPPVIHGYLDELSETQVVGWMWNPYSPKARLRYEVALALPEGDQLIAEGIANQFYPPLHHASVGDACYGFQVEFSKKLTPLQRRHLVVRPILTQRPIARAPEIEGYVDERSTSHVAGWVRNRFDTEERVEFEVVLASPGHPERLLAAGRANLLNLPLAQQSIGDGHYGFRLHFEHPLTEIERDSVIVRPTGNATLPLSPYLVTAFEPIDHIAIDIVNNCNLRCPFCLFDYAELKTTRTMSSDTFDALIPLLPYVRDGNFWLSCLHEPTLNPDFLGFIEKIPKQWRRKVMFTSNLAKRMPAAYFETLAASGISHINISLESLDPAIFERMRKGAKWNIFKENWDRLISAWKSAGSPPRLRYIIMAYKSNRDELPGLVKYLRAECHPWQIEIRHTYNALHIAADFRESEFLHEADWAWLASALGGYSVDEVMLIPPPEMDMPVASGPTPNGAEPPGSSMAEPVKAEDPTQAPVTLTMTEPVTDRSRERRLTQPFNIQVDWDGKLVVYGKWNDPPELKEFSTTNINQLAEPFEFLMAL